MRGYLWAIGGRFDRFVLLVADALLFAGLAVAALGVAAVAVGAYRILSGLCV